MQLQDFFLTPIFIILIYVVAYGIRKKNTSNITRKYFIPALSVKIIGSIGFALIYQFYYGDWGKPAGDTFNYYKQSSYIFEAFGESFTAGIKLLFANGERDPETLAYSTRMIWYKAPTEYSIIRIAAFLSLFTFNTYTVIGLLFACISFSGLWALYSTFARINPILHKELALSILFIPSVFFWGSGLMKDTLCIGAIGWLFSGFYSVFIENKKTPKSLIHILLGLYLLYSIKVYILLCFLPFLLYWVINEFNEKIQNKSLRILVKPLFIIIGVGASYFTAINLTKGDKQYDVSKLAERSKITADYLYSVSQREGGSAYNLGELDGTATGMLKLAPQAIVVTLFRPFIWEVRNPVMLLSALESLWFLLFTLSIFYRVGVVKTFKHIIGSPILTLCFFFSIVFSIAVGTSTSNFGTLVRYKIPMIPFYVAGLYLLNYQTKSKTKQKHSVKSNHNRLRSLQPSLHP